MKVSVCIPTYNQSAYIEKAIRSVVNQSFRPFEVIVSDDRSTDSTIDVLEQLEKEIPYLKIIRQPVNLGVALNTDTCLRAASGDYIVRLDSDDFLLPDYVETLCDLMNKFPNAGYAHSAVKEIDANDNFTRERKLLRTTGFLNADLALKASLKGYKVAANIVLFRKSALESVNYISANVNFVEDFYLSVKIAEKGYGNVYFSGILCCYRVWTDAGKVRVKRKKDDILGITKVFNDVIFPAYQKRAWNINRVKRAKEKFAKTQAKCLGWDIYSNNEKNELKELILNLSGSNKTRFFVWLYQSGNGKIVDFFSNIGQFIKLKAKKIILSSVSGRGRL